MKKLDNLEKFVRVPDVNFYGVYFYDGEDIELNNETVTEGENELTIIDCIKDGYFYKHKILKMKKNDLTEETNLKYAVKKGQALAYIENMGFVEVKGIISLEEAIKRLKMLDSKYWDEKGNLKSERS